MNGGVSNIKGRFIGQNGSCGFYRGKIYRVSTFCKNNWIILKTSDGLWCPYGSLEKLLENWNILESGRKYDKCN